MKSTYPTVGQKIKFVKPTEHHWFVNIVADEKRLLKLGQEYTVTKIEEASSCCYVEFTEFPTDEKDLPFFNLWAFEW